MEYYCFINFTEFPKNMYVQDSVHPLYYFRIIFLVCLVVSCQVKYSTFSLKHSINKDQAQLSDTLKIKPYIFAIWLTLFENIYKASLLMQNVITLKSILRLFCRIAYIDWQNLIQILHPYHSYQLNHNFYYTLNCNTLYTY